MQTGPIGVDIVELSKIAAFTYCGATNTLKHDCRVEFSKGTRGFYFNQLTEYDPPPEIDRQSIAPQYRTQAIISKPEDVETLLGADIDETLPGIIFFPDGMSAYSMPEVTDTVQKLGGIIKAKIAAGRNRDWWENILFVPSGSGAAHRLVNALHNLPSSIKRQPIAKLPPIQVGDRISLTYRPETRSFWLSNLEMIGDGRNVLALTLLPETPPVTKIGLKAHNIREVLAKADLRTPPAFSVSADAFYEILIANGVQDIYDSLPDATAEDIPKIFREISDKLKIVPPNISELLIRIIERQFPNQPELRLIARSTAILEDNGNENNYAGTFSSVPNLKLRQDTGVVFDSSPSLEEGILEVIKSAFTEELARSIAGKLPNDRKAVLRDWIMPVLVMPMIEAMCSGVVLHGNRYSGNPHEIVVEMERGVGGIVANDGQEIVRVIVPETEVLRDKPKKGKIAILLIDSEKKEKPLSAEELPKHLGSTVGIPQLIAIARGLSTLSQRQGHPQDAEFAIDNEGMLFWTQTRDFHM